MSAAIPSSEEYGACVDALAEALAADDAASFRAALARFDALRESEVLTGVRKIATDLHHALERFHVESRLIALAQRQVPDARARLAHVLRLTNSAAHRTMDLVEECCPLADRIAREAERLMALQETAELTRTLRPQLNAYLQLCAQAMTQVRSKLAEVLLAQGYQDLSGQIVRGVMTLVDELETALGELGHIAGPEAAAPGTGSPEPGVPGIAEPDKIEAQGAVDELLSNVGH